MPGARVWLLPEHAHFADTLAGILWQAFAHQAPDLSALTLVTPAPALGLALQHSLLKRAGGVLLAPTAHTLGTLAPPATAVSSPLACRIRIAEAVTRHRSLFPAQTPLSVADALYALFEELEQQQLGPEASEQALQQRLQRGYGLPQALPALSREAAIVHRLYLAFREDVGRQAPAAAAADALAATLEHWPAGRPLVFAGFDALSAAQAHSMGAALQRGAWWFAQGRLSGRDGSSVQRLFAGLGMQPEQLELSHTPRAALLDACFADDGLASERAADLGGATGSGLQLHAARDAEHEAQMADLAVRQALLDGARNVAVIANDRRLARRLRARLERAGIALKDRGGWALSTSRAAAAVNDWLSCAEKDFPYRALLDLAKCGLLPQGLEWAAAAEPLAYQKSIAGGWLHWRRHAVGEAQIAWLELLQHASGTLDTLHGAHPAAAHAKALKLSLARLKLDAALADDVAGQAVLGVLDDLATALAPSTLQMRWPAFRVLLDQALEDASFTPETRGSQVQLLTLAQAQGLAAEVIVLTGANARLLAAGRVAPFFNSGVRRELGLSTPAQQQQLALTRLKRLLLAAPTVHLLYAPLEAGEPALLAPALQALRAFAEAAGAALLADSPLARDAPQAEVAANSALPEPLAAPLAQAGEAVTVVLDRSGLSASGHQALIDCPYRFHARYALGLALADDPDEPANRRDYGERVHSILQAFYEPLEDYPPPYSGPLISDCRADIEHALQLLAAHAFADDIKERPLGRAWQQEFARALPWLATQIIRAAPYAVQVELEMAEEHAGIKLKGKLDRLESSAAQETVVDYKTGAVPTRASILRGEQVQLSHYALLRPAVNAIAYWDLKAQKSISVDDSMLEALRPRVSERLQQLGEALRRQAVLPANGAAVVCTRCDYAGLCRIPAEQRLALHGSPKP